MITDIPMVMNTGIPTIMTTIIPMAMITDIPTIIPTTTESVRQIFLRMRYGGATFRRAQDVERSSTWMHRADSRET